MCNSFFKIIQQSFLRSKKSSSPSACFAITLIFFINGLVFSNWVTRIPNVQQSLGLSAGALGLALWGTAIGALTSQFFAGWLVQRMGSRRTTTLAALLYCCTLILPALAPNLPILALALFALGISNSMLDIAMNVQGIAIERQASRPILASLHASFSFGGVAGSLLGGLFIGLKIAPLPHLLSIAIGCGVIAYVASRWLLGDEEKAERESKKAAFPHLSRQLLLLGSIAFCGLLGEGAVADWSTVYMKSGIHASPVIAAGGFAAFSLTMATGRLAGNYLIHRWGSVVLLRSSSLLAAAGMLLSLLARQPLIAIVGYGLFGAGLSCIFPIVLRITGHLERRSTAAAIALVSTIGYVGFLAGPPLIGFLAEAVTLRWALGIVVGLSLFIALLAKNASS